MRLHRFIAQCGVTSRRKAEDLIREGLVSVNGVTVTEMGVSVDPETDQVEVEGKPVALPDKRSYLFNKPRGIVTTLSDPRGRPTVAGFFPGDVKGLKPVGRLDMQTEGLMIVTNDGELAALLSHPRHGVEKEYVAQVKGVPESKAIERLRKGVWIEGGRTAPASVDLTGTDPKTGTSLLTLIIHEGRKHQVRLMCEAVGHPVVHLKRVRIGPFRLKGLSSGEMRKLSQKEVEALRLAARKG